MRKIFFLLLAVIFSPIIFWLNGIFKWFPGPRDEDD